MLDIKDPRQVLILFGVFDVLLLPRFLAKFSIVANWPPNLSSSWLHFQTEKLTQEQSVSDWTQLFLYMVLGIAALSTTSFPLSEIKWIFFWMSAGCFGLSLVCIIYGWKKREKIDRQKSQTQAARD